jgi:hypothetical protein
MMNKRDVAVEAAWKHLNKAVVGYKGKPVGTVAALGTGKAVLNYDQVFTRDFFVSALAFLLNGRFEIVRNFLSVTSELQRTDKSSDCFTANRGLMPASFKIVTENGKETLRADFGEHAIGRVTPVDASLWWLLLLRLYVNASDDRAFAARKRIQQATAAILDLYLVAHFELIPTLLVPDGAFMIDRRMGMYGHPLDIEVLFYAALRAAREILLIVPTEENSGYVQKVEHRLGHLIGHIHENYWLDKGRVERMCTFGQEEFGIDVANKYNIYPASVPEWVQPWVGEAGGYFAGNIGPGRMDFRFLALGNLLSIITDLADGEQQEKILSLFEKQKHRIVAQTPIKACYPALEGRDWDLITGADQKNTPWSYHNGGSWPFLLWLLAAVSIKTGRQILTKQGLARQASKLAADDWPEYYDDKEGATIGKEARRFQVWTIAGFIAADSLLETPDKTTFFIFEDKIHAADCPLRRAR